MPRPGLIRALPRDASVVIWKLATGNFVFLSTDSSETPDVKGISDSRIPFNISYKVIHIFKDDSIWCTRTIVMPVLQNYWPLIFQSLPNIS